MNLNWFDLNPMYSDAMTRYDIIVYPCMKTINVNDTVVPLEYEIIPDIDGNALFSSSKTTREYIMKIK